MSHQKEMYKHAEWICFHSYKNTKNVSHFRLVAACIHVCWEPSIWPFRWNFGSARSDGPIITSGRPLATELVLVEELTLGRRHAIAHELTFSRTTMAAIVFDGIHSSTSYLWPPGTGQKRKERNRSGNRRCCFSQSSYLVPALESIVQLHVTAGGN